MYLRGCRAVGILVDMREDNIKMDNKEIAHAAVVWTEINFIKT